MNRKRTPKLLFPEISGNQINLGLVRCLSKIFPGNRIGFSPVGYVVLSPGFLVLKTASIHPEIKLAVNTLWVMLHGVLPAL